MKVNVLMASGQEDEWVEIADAIEDRGSLVVLDYIETDEVSDDRKVMTIKTETEQPSPPGKIYNPIFAEKHTSYYVLAVYAPGMWIKVEYNA